MKLFLMISIIMILQSCGPSNQMVKFSLKQKEVYTNNNLKTFLATNPRANIVLRVSNIAEQGITKSTNDKMIGTNETNQSMDIYYNAIEKELLRAGFSVRDRGLFNEVLSKMQRDNQQNIDYSQIKELTNTDLILEVIKINPAVPYETNQTYVVNKKGNQVSKTNYNSYKRYGASAEYKIILLKNNEMAGTYTFNYAPCIDGCPISTFNNKSINKSKKPNPDFKTKVNSVTPYEGVEKDVMEDFIRKSTQDLITAMKN
jgi:hypothetical protein